MVLKPRCAENASREIRDAVEALGGEETHSLQTRILFRSRVVGVCKRPSFGEARSLDWSHSVFVGLISVAKLLSSPKSLEHLGTTITEPEMLWGLGCKADSRFALGSGYMDYMEKTSLNARENTARVVCVKTFPWT